MLGASFRRESILHVSIFRHKVHYLEERRGNVICGCLEHFEDTKSMICNDGLVRWCIILYDCVLCNTGQIFCPDSHFPIPLDLQLLHHLLRCAMAGLPDPSNALILFQWNLVATCSKFILDLGGRGH